MRSKAIYQKAIISGRIAELYDYSRPLIQGYNGKRVGRANSAFTSEEVKEENRKKTASRARATVRRMINANPQLNKFLTLTFTENLQDILTNILLDYVRNGENTTDLTPSKVFGQRRKQ